MQSEAQGQQLSESADERQTPDEQYKTDNQGRQTDRHQTNSTRQTTKADTQTHMGQILQDGNFGQNVVRF